MARLDENEWQPIGNTFTPPAPKSGIIRRAVGDTAVDAAQGAVGLGQSIVGLADLGTFGLAGDALNAIGYDPQRTQQIMSEWYSPERQAAEQQVQNAEGFFGTAGALIDNPSALVGRVVQSAPQMAGSIAAARHFALKAAGSGASQATQLLHATRAGAATEGALTAGSVGQNIRSAATDDSRGRLEQYWSVPAGLGTAAIGYGAGRLLPEGQLETFLVPGQRSANPAGIIRRIGTGVLSEGLLEEMPQSAQEQFFTNVGQGNPYMQGVPEAAGEGAVVGGVSGGLFGAARRNTNPMTPRDLLAPPQDQPVEQPFTGTTLPRLDPDAQYGQTGTLFGGQPDFMQDSQAASPQAEGYNELLAASIQLQQMAQAAQAAGDAAQFQAIQSALQQVSSQMVGMGDNAQRRLFDTGVYEMVGDRPYELTGDQAAAGGLQTLEGELETVPQDARTSEIRSILVAANGGKNNAQLMRFVPEFRAALEQGPDAAQAVINKYDNARSTLQPSVLETADQLVGMYWQQNINALAQEGARRAQPGVTVGQAPVSNETELAMREANAVRDTQETAAIEAMIADEQDNAAMESLIPERQPKVGPDGQQRLFTATEMGPLVEPTPAEPPAQAQVDQSAQRKLIDSKGRPVTQPKPRAVSVQPTKDVDAATPVNDGTKAFAKAAPKVEKPTRTVRTTDANADLTRGAENATPLSETGKRIIRQLDKRINDTNKPAFDVYTENDIRQAVEDGDFDRANSLLRDNYRTPDGQQPPSNAISDQDLRKIVAAVEKALGGDAGVTILDSVTQWDAKQKPGSRAGVMSGGNIVLFRDGISDGIDGQKTIFHELFHKGLRKLIPEAEYASFMNRLYQQSAEVRKLADTWLKNDSNKQDVANLSPEMQRAVAVDEVLAEMAENTQINPSTLRQIGNWLASVADRLGLKQLAQWLRGAGPTPLRQFINDALKASVKDGTSYGQMFRPGTDAFQRWFGDSKAVDADGKPLVVYHGTKGDFAEFEPNESGIFFAARPEAASAYAIGWEDEGAANGGNVIPAYLSLQNPLTTTREWLTKFADRVGAKAMAEAKAEFGGSSLGLEEAFEDSEQWARELVMREAKRLGYDGLILPADTLPIEHLGGDWEQQPAYVAFEPTQVKSAIGNNGQYDPTKPDIRYRTATAEDVKSAYNSVANKLRYDALGKARRGVLASMFLSDLAETYGPKIEGVSDYAKAISDQSSAEAKYQEGGEKVQIAFNKLKADKHAELIDFMATVTESDIVVEPDAKRDNSHLVTTEEKAKARELQQRFARMNDDQKAAYRLARDTLAKNWKDRGEALSKITRQTYDPLIEAARDKGNEKQARELERTRDSVLRENNQVISSVKGDYFPMLRFGDYLVVQKSAEFQAKQEEVNAAYKELTDLTEKLDTKTPEERKAIRKFNREHKDSDVALEEFTPEEQAQLNEARKKYRTLQSELDGMKDSEKDYTVTAFENESSARMYQEANGGDVALRSEHEASVNPITHSMLAKLKEALASRLGTTGNAQMVLEAQRAMYDIYISSLPDRSALKRQAKRRGVAGFERDMQRSIAASILQDSFYIPRLQYGDAVNEALLKVERVTRESKDVKQQEVSRELAKRHALGLKFSPTPIQDKLASMAYIWRLGVSPAYLFTNMTQPFVVTAPMLYARHGMKGMTALGRAMKDTFKLAEKSLSAGNKLAQIDFQSLPEGERNMLQQMLDSNLLNVTLVQELARTAEGKGISWVTSMLAKPSHYVEQINRIASALAAYRMERAKSSEAEAIKYTARVLNDTHFNYSIENSPRWMKPGAVPLGKLFFQFKKYQVGMISLFTKTALRAMKGQSAEVKAEARKQLVGLLATHGAIGGLIGLPAAQIVLSAFSMIAGDDEEPFDAEIELRNWAYDTMGKDAGDAFMKGLPTLLGMDLSKRIGLGDLLNPLPTMRTDKEGRELWQEVLMAGAGPAIGGLGGQTADAMMYLAKGDFVKAVEQLMPKFIMDPIKAGRFATEGLTTRSGVTAVDREMFSTWDLVQQAAGLSPLSINDKYEARAFVEEKKQELGNVATRYKQEWLKARKDGDAQAMKETWDHIRENVNPARVRNGLKPITQGELLKFARQRGKQEESYATYGANVGKNADMARDTRFAQ